jgi:hypothetical protein
MISAPEQFTATHREVERLKDELQAEKAKSIEMRKSQVEFEAPKSGGLDEVTRDGTGDTDAIPPSLWRQPPGKGDTSDGSVLAIASPAVIPTASAASTDVLLASGGSQTATMVAQSQTSDPALTAASSSSSQVMDESQGTSITVKTQGQSITISIANDETVHGSTAALPAVGIESSAGVVAPTAPTVVTAQAQLPSPSLLARTTADFAAFPKVGGTELAATPPVVVPQIATPPTPEPSPLASTQSTTAQPHLAVQASTALAPAPAPAAPLEDRFANMAIFGR